MVARRDDSFLNHMQEEPTQMEMLMTVVKEMQEDIKTLAHNQDILIAQVTAHKEAFKTVMDLVDELAMGKA